MKSRSGGRKNAIAIQYMNSLDILYYGSTAESEIILTVTFSLSSLAPGPDNIVTVMCIYLIQHNDRRCIKKKNNPSLQHKKTYLSSKHIFLPRSSLRTPQGVLVAHTYRSHRALLHVLQHDNPSVQSHDSDLLHPAGHSIPASPHSYWMSLRFAPPVVVKVSSLAGLVRSAWTFPHPTILQHGRVVCDETGNPMNFVWVRRAIVVCGLKNKTPSRGKRITGVVNSPFNNKHLVAVTKRP